MNGRLFLNKYDRAKYISGWITVLLASLGLCSAVIYGERIAVPIGRLCFAMLITYINLESLVGGIMPGKATGVRTSAIARESMPIRFWSSIIFMELIAIAFFIAGTYQLCVQVAYA